jgi:DNA-binding transcriptional LysR family regulator
MRLGFLRIFCDLIETRNFTLTAKKHGVTQSAVSQMLRSMERDAGAQIIIRRGPHVFGPTQAGELYCRHSREIIRLAEELDRRMHEAKTTAGGVIELAACHSIGLHQLPPLLEQYQRAFPAVEVRVSYGLIDRVHDAVAENVVDFGLVCYPRRLPGLAIDLFRQERLVLACHPAHPLAARPAVAVTDLAGHPLVAWNEIHRSPWLRRVPKNQLHLFQPAHEFNQVELVKRAVEMDAGVAILPEAVVLPEVARQILAAVPFEDGGHTEPLGIIYRRKKILSPAITGLINLLKQPSPAAN